MRCLPGTNHLNVVPKISAEQRSNRRQTVQQPHQTASGTELGFQKPICRGTYQGVHGSEWFRPGEHFSNLPCGHPLGQGDVALECRSGSNHKGIHSQKEFTNQNYFLQQPASEGMLRVQVVVLLSNKANSGTLKTRGSYEEAEETYISSTNHRGTKVNQLILPLPACHRWHPWDPKCYLCLNS